MPNITLNATTNDVGGVASINGGQLAGLRNRIINGNFGINQRAYVSGAAVGSGLYGHDRWKMAASGDTYTFSTTANVTTVTVPVGKVLQQVIEGVNLETGTYVLSWSGTAQGKIGAGSYAASGVTGSITGGTNTTIEFGPGTVSKVQLAIGSVVSTFEERHTGLEEMLCQPYARLLNNRGWVGQATSSTNVQITGVISPPMRAIPSATLLDTTPGVRQVGTGFAATGASIAGGTLTKNAYDLGISGFTGLTAGGLCTGNKSSDSILLVAEL